MFVSKSVNVDHADLIHDISYDFYGKRMATCSSDQMVKVWDLSPNGEWNCTARWRNHLGPVWRVTWAHPEFGQVIATCSFDKSIEIWEEICGNGKLMNSANTVSDVQNEQNIDGNNDFHNDKTDKQNTSTNVSAARGGPSTSMPSSLTWVRRARCVDPRTSVTGLEFAPRHMGLQLAAISIDGFLRIYEAQDVMNLSQWTLQIDFPTKLTGSCLSWSQSRLHVPLIAVGGCSSSECLSGALSLPPSYHGQSKPSSGGSTQGQLALYEYADGSRQWHLVATAYGQPTQNSADTGAVLSSSSEHHLACAALHDLAFAPHLGQSSHCLAVAMDTGVCILRVVEASGGGGVASGGVAKYRISIAARFEQHGGNVWHVAWNMSGSLLASSGEDSCVRLWQANYLDDWQPVSVIQAGENDFPMGLPIPPPTTSQSQQQQQSSQPPPLNQQKHDLRGMGIHSSLLPSQMTPVSMFR